MMLCVKKKACEKLLVILTAIRFMSFY